MINAKQIRAARALLDWNQADLALASDLSVQTIKNIENARTNPHPDNMAALQAALEKAGVEFTQDNGVRNRSALTILEGENCFLQLLDDIYYTLRSVRGEVLFHCVDDSKSPPDVVTSELRLRKAGIKSRCTISEDNTFIPYPLTEYRCIPKRHFRQNTKAIYADKVATIIDENQTIFIIRNQNFADNEREIFELIWNIHKAPKESTAPIKYDGEGNHV